MKALIKQKNCVPKLVQIPPPVRGNNIIVKPLYIGLCRTDLKIADGAFDHTAIPEHLILGHEACCQVVHSNSNEFKVNDYVVINPYFDNQFVGFDIQGMLAEEVEVPAKQLVKISPDMDKRLAAFLEPISVARGVLNHQFNGMVGIYGDSRIAKLTALILQTVGVPSINITHCNPNDYNNHFDTIIETDLNNFSFSDAVKMLKKNGVIILKSRNCEKVSFNPIEFLQKEIQIKSVFYNNFHTSLEWLLEHQDKILPLFGKSYSLEHWQEAFEQAKKEDFKIFIHIQE